MYVWKYSYSRDSDIVNHSHNHYNSLSASQFYSSPIMQLITFASAALLLGYTAARPQQQGASCFDAGDCFLAVSRDTMRMLGYGWLCKHSILVPYR